MDDGNEVDLKDQEWRNKSEGRCGKHNWEKKSSETEIVRPCGEKDWRSSNENVEHGSGWTPKDRKTETEVEWCCCKKIHEGETSKDRRSTRPVNNSIEIGNSMSRSEVRKRSKKKKNQHLVLPMVCLFLIANALRWVILLGVSLRVSGAQL